MNNLKVEKIMEVIEGNYNIGMDLAKEVNSINNTLEFLDFHLLEDVNDIFDGSSPSDIMMMIHNGYFNPYDKYFRLDQYGAIETMSVKEVDSEISLYSEEIATAFIEAYEDYKDIYDFYIADEIKNILEEEEEA